METRKIQEPIVELESVMDTAMDEKMGNPEVELGYWGTEGGDCLYVPIEKNESEMDLVSLFD